jgi:glycosyltransferase involved in cell wall biosynthesis
MRLRIAWFSPLPPQRSGVAEYSADLLPYLRERADIDVFVEDPLIHRGTGIAAEFSINHYLSFPDRMRRERYDLCVYQMGNDIVHRFVFLTLLGYPGLVVLHEPMLHHFMLQMLSHGWTMRDYAYELDYNYGTRRPDIEAMVAADATELARFEYPMIQRVVDSSLGIIVHSEFAADEVMRCDPACPVEVVPHAYVPEPSVERLSVDNARKRLGLDPEAFYIGAYGFMNPSKRVDLLLDCLEALAGETSEARLFLAGGTIEEYPVADIVREKGLAGRVDLTGYLEWNDMLAAMKACDVAVAMRCPSAGETPGSVIRLFGLGKPVVVPDYKAYAEFPDEICVKVPVENAAEALAPAILRCYRNRGGLVEMGERARRYAVEHCSPELVASRYLDFAERLLLCRFDSGRPDSPGDRRGVEDRFLEEIAAPMGELDGGWLPEGALQDVSRVIDDLLRGT